MTDVRLFLTYILLYLAWMICPGGKRHHIKVAAHFVEEDFLADECAAARRRIVEKKTS